MDNSTKNNINIISFITKFAAIILLIIGILSIFITAYMENTLASKFEMTSYKYSIGILEILFSLLLFALLSLFSKKILKSIPTTIILALVITFSAILYIFWIKTIRITPIDDQKVISELALAIKGKWIDFYNNPGMYLFLFPYQFGIAYIVSIVYKIFGEESYLSFQFVNATFSLINIILMYKISNQIFKDNKQIKLITCMLLGLFTIYFMFFNVYFYGNIIGLTFALFSMYLLLTNIKKDNNFLKYCVTTFLSGISIAISIKLKTNYYIFLIAILIVFILDLIEKRKAKNLIALILFMVGIFSINFTYNKIVKSYNLTLNSGIPMINYIYMGMAEERDLAPGWYTDDIKEIYEQANNNESKDKEIAIEKIDSRLKYFANNPLEFIKYYSQKIASTWLNPTFQTIWCSLPGNQYNLDAEYSHYLGYHETALSMVAGNLSKIEEFYFNILEITIFIFSGIGLINLSKQKDIPYFILPLTFLGGFAFHILWETKAIYVIQYYFILIPIASYGIYFIDLKLEEKIKKIKETKKASF